LEFSRFGLTCRVRAKPAQTPEAVISTLTLPAEDLGLEILIAVISKINATEAGFSLVMRRQYNYISGSNSG